MIKINFDYLDEGLPLEKGSANIMVIESSTVFSKVMFSLYNHENYFKIYDDSEYKTLSEKNILLILNPLLFDFQERNIKSIIYTYLENQIREDIDFADGILLDYQNIANKITNYIETVGEIQFDYNVGADLKDLFKLIGISLNQDDITSIFDKVQLLINVINEMSSDKLLIFMNLNSLLSETEYKYVLEEIEMKSLTVLIIENNKNHLKNVTHYLLDNDFDLSKI